MAEVCRISKELFLFLLHYWTSTIYSMTGLRELPFPGRLLPLRMTTVVYQVEPETYT